MFSISSSLDFTGKCTYPLYIQHCTAATRQPWTAGSMGTRGGVIVICLTAFPNVRTRMHILYPIYACREEG